MEPLHFHRKDHRPQYNHTNSSTAPNTIPKTRRYIFPDRATDPAVPKPTVPKALKSDISDLSAAMRRTAISSPAKRYQSMGPEEIAKVLRHWQSDVGFMAAVQDKAKRNPFPGIDMNKDWNRAACELHMHFSENWGEPDERMKIQQAFAGYSLWRQLEPIELELEELKGVFAKVFVGEGPGKESCSRIPGSWWATRKNLFDGNRGMSFVERVASETIEIYEKTEEWKKNGRGVSGTRKRKRPHRHSIPSRRIRPFRRREKLSEQVMSDELRARRSIQEKKAGRWTDGSIRMDKLWHGFHWVLPDEDWKNKAWRQLIREVDGKDIWEKKESSED